MRNRLLGIEIEILLDDVRKNESGLSHQHCAVGRIHYPATERHEAETGYLLYIKSAVTGDEDEVIREYRANHPTFPHESTADQFFDEGQFEAYRALGYHAVDGLFAEDQRVDDYHQLEHWFRDIESNLAPSLVAEELFFKFRVELGEIQDLLRRPQYAHYFYQIYPRLRPVDYRPAELGTEAAADQLRHNLFLVGKQLRLMESVFVALHLERVRNQTFEGNEGWMRLFREWSGAWKTVPYFLDAYHAEIRIHSPKLREFCIDILEMPEAPKEETAAGG